MKKAIHIIIIIAFLIAICTIEQIMAQAYLKEAKKQVENLISISSQPFNEKTDELMFYTNELEKYWTEKENILCTFVNHREIEDIGIEISKLQTAIKNNEQKIYVESINLILFYIISYQHVIGINAQSIF